MPRGMEREGEAHREHHPGSRNRWPPRRGPGYPACTKLLADPPDPQRVPCDPLPQELHEGLGVTPRRACRRRRASASRLTPPSRIWFSRTRTALSCPCNTTFGQPQDEAGHGGGQ